MNSQQGSGQNPGQRSKQFCSVCKEWLEMEVVPTGDGDDDGVVWYRCPQCQGFLPKLKSAEETQQPEEIVETGSTAEDASSAVDLDEDLPFDSPAEMMAARRAAEAAPTEEVEPDVDGPVASGDDVLLGTELPDLDLAGAEDDELQESSEEEQSEAAEPIAEYAAQLAEALAMLPTDSPGGRPYRPWETYEVGQCVQHLAWQDCGIVVGKETLPGNRRVIKAYFQEAGVVRLIEQAPK